MAARTAAPRLLALDAFRGGTIAAMILVNDAGDWNHTYWPLLHARWHGWTPTDLVFPFFLFIVGVALTLSTRLEARPALLRAAKLFGLGLLVNTWPTFGLVHLRIPGVLQRIAICYLVAWAARRWLRPSQQAVAAVLLLAGYWFLMTHVRGPEGHPPGLETETNLAAQVDRALLPNNLYQWTRTWDPEGFLSTLPAIATALLGLLGGQWLKGPWPPAAKALGFLVAGAVFTLAGVWWGEWAPAWLLFPINKGLWSPSFVLLTAGLGSALLGLTYWLVDANGGRCGRRPSTGRRRCSPA